MKSQSILSQILYADSLLSMEGIIPSVSIWYEKIQQLILALQQSLQENGSSPEQATSFCLLVCDMLDMRMNELKVKNHWIDSEYSLAAFLYGKPGLGGNLMSRLHNLEDGQSETIATLCKTLQKWMSLRKGNIQNPRIEVDYHKMPAELPAPLKSRRFSSKTKMLLLTFSSLVFLISLWLLLKTYSHV
ncbi:hypothetical protein C9426_31635 [Serratia sp. S1B]|nr:hypothetical protein C9426_31635 [Serratia sp. S1B]